MVEVTSARDDRAPRIALVLPGGGARSAYQVGVLKAIAAWYPPGTQLPFRIVCGTSAGAIVAAVLAAYAGRFRRGTVALERVWRGFHVGQVFRVDRGAMLRSGLQLLLALVSAGLLMAPPRALFDNSPLRRLLERKVSFARIGQSLDAGHLDALAIAATNFGSGESVSFVQAANGLEPWARAGRRGVAAEASPEHLMASAAIPFLFPPVKLEGSYYGDGAMRQLTPLSSAVRLGAERLLVIGVREPGRTPLGARMEVAPSFGQLFGFMLDSLFMEGLQADIEHLQRINDLLETCASPGALGLRPITPLLLMPREDLSAVALEHRAELPRSLRVLLRTMGTSQAAAGQLTSFLLFESGYTRALIELGREDAEARRGEIEAFLGIGPAPGCSGQEQRAEAQ